MSPSSCILISSKLTQGPRNPNQPRPGSSPNISLHKPPFILLMGMFVLKSKVNVGRPFYCLVHFDLLVHVVCVVRWPLATGRGNGKLLAQKSVQINMFHFLWMLDRHWKRDCLHSDGGHPLLAFSSLLFSNHWRDMTHLNGCLLALEEEPKHFWMNSCLQFN